MNHRSTHTTANAAFNPGSDRIAPLLPPEGAAREAFLDALIYLCGQPQAMVDAGIDAFLNQSGQRAN